MPANPSTELTTSATDALLAILALVGMVRLERFRTASRWKVSVWCAVFGLLALSSTLGAVSHGVTLPPAIDATLWQLLFASLGFVVALMGVAAVLEIWGSEAGRVALPWSILGALGFYVATRVWPDDFRVFIVYEGSVMLFVLGAYTVLTLKRTPGAGIIASGVLVTLAAAVVQATSWSATLIWEFDHNGLFHLVQIPGLALLIHGVRVRLESEMVEVQQTARATVGASPFPSPRT